jgi:two-component system, chemotaxis family, response regulator Rcp1
MEENVSEKVILVIEHNQNHAQLIQAILKEESLQNQVVVIEDGTQAMEYLHQVGAYVKAPRPDLILLDLHLPGKSGREVLAELKASSVLKRIPIVILTTSDDEDDIFASYEFQGNCYVVKSIDLNRLAAIVQRIKDFWLGIVTLPQC